MLGAPFSQGAQGMLEDSRLCAFSDVTLKILTPSVYVKLPTLIG